MVKNLDNFFDGRIFTFLTTFRWLKFEVYPAWIYLASLIIPYMSCEFTQKAPGTGELVLMGIEPKKPYFMLGIISGTLFL